MSDSDSSNAVAITQAAESIVEAIGVLTDQTLETKKAIDSVAEAVDRLTEQLTAFTETITDREGGVYMTPNMKPDRYGDDQSAAQQAAFEIAMEESGKLEKLREKLNDPTYGS
jgi:hypothetical protein